MRINLHSKAQRGATVIAVVYVALVALSFLTGEWQSGVGLIVCAALFFLWWWIASGDDDD